MERHRGALLVAAVAGPVLVAAAATLVRGVLANTSAALVLVLVVVAVATAGDRVAGAVAALSAAASFDFFLTVPYFQLAIVGRDDIETAVLLLAIGVAVSEISLYARRHQARTRRIEGYLRTVAEVAAMAAAGGPRGDLVARVESTITDVLDLDKTDYETATGPRVPSDRPGIDRTGAVTWDGHTIDVARYGLPTMDVIELPAGRGGPEDGRFLLTASTRLRRPSRDQLLVAITLAEQVTSPSVPPVDGYVTGGSDRR